MNTVQRILVILSLVVLAGVVLTTMPADVLAADTGDIGQTASALFGKNLDIWFMLMLVAFLMMFIKKYEWGVALAVLLSAAGSYIAYLAIQQFVFGEEIITQAMMVRAVICSITLVIAIGVFLGTVKSWQYLMVGLLFAPVYAFVEWFMANPDIIGAAAADPGGSILVHMCAAYFGLGVAMAIRDKRAFDEPMHTTTHSVTFVWLASMLLWMLWPSFVTAGLTDSADVQLGTLTCFMAGIGSVISAYAVCMIVEKKVNPLTYTYALLAGPVAIGATMLIVDPWGALLVGLIAGAVSALCFIYLQPRLCKMIGVLDVMGVHNLHGMGGWVGVILSCVILGTFTNLFFAACVVGITLVAGAAIGLLARFTRGKMDIIMDDDPDFIKNEEPAA
ncbi:MAG: ammonium transporter [Candidatus Methanomethylophilaceae archaeon]|jgi:ammonium transporter Rh|nr:ammonium transporter [Candidatus Methanomethylophilaceae archaeon]